MCYEKQKKIELGLSLIELMVVVAIIGILAAIAIPRFQLFMTKARQTEAKTNLNHIYAFQTSYFGDNDSYAELPNVGYLTNSGSGGVVTNCNLPNDLGFKLTDCRKVRYIYSSSPVITGSTGFLAQAASGGTGLPGVIVGENLIFPGCDVPDIWFIDNFKNLENRALFPGLIGNPLFGNIGKSSTDYCL